MIADLFKSFANLFSITGILGFLVGVVFEYTFLKLRCRYLDKTHPEEGKHRVRIKRVYWVWALVFIVIGGLTYKAQVTSDQVIKITKETQECSAQFNAALKARAEISAEERDINARWQDVTFERAGKLTELVVKYGDVGNPEYLKARVFVDKEYYDAMNQIFKNRDETAERRQMLGGYPEPTCGK